MVVIPIVCSSRSIFFFFSLKKHSVKTARVIKMPISLIVFYFYSSFVLPAGCDEQTSALPNSQKLSFSEWQIATTSRLFPEIWLTWFWINLFYQIIIKKETGDISFLLLLIPVHNIPDCFPSVSKTMPNNGWHIGQGFCSNMKSYLWHDFCAKAPLRRNALSLESGTLSPIRLQERCYVSRQSDCCEIENPDIRALRHVSSEKHQ